MLNLILILDNGGTFTVIQIHPKALIIKGAFSFLDASRHRDATAQIIEG